MRPVLTKRLDYYTQLYSIMADELNVMKITMRFKKGSLVFHWDTLRREPIGWTYEK